jgi:hypothetical protein
MVSSQHGVLRSHNMKPKHLLALGVLAAVAAGSLTAAQKPAPPQLTEQQKLKERVDAHDSEIKALKEKADRAAIEKDYIERTQKQHESDYKKVLSSQTTLDHTKTVIEILAYGAALAFFLYKAIAGYLITQMALTIACKRAHATTPGDDHLAVVATLKKGKTGTLRLHDAQARLTLPTGSLPPIELIGIERLTFVKDKLKWPNLRWTKPTRRKIEWRLAEKNAFLNLAPGDQAQFSCRVVVPSNVPVIVEVAVLGQRLGSRYRSQWRASTVSLPVQP